MFFTLVALCLSLTSEPAGLASCAWLAGTWKSPPGAQPVCQEVWNIASDGSMMGMFRMEVSGRPTLYEFQLIEADASDVFLRLRHFGTQLTDRDSAPAKLRLAQATERLLVFENLEGNRPKKITYRRDDENGLVVTVVTMRDGKPTQFELKFAKVK